LTRPLSGGRSNGERRHRRSVPGRIGAAEELVQRLAGDAEAKAVCDLFQ
jgi:hypothetical protein